MEKSKIMLENEELNCIKIGIIPFILSYEYFVDVGGTIDRTYILRYASVKIL
jgi:hypothetical protein